MAGKLGGYNESWWLCHRVDVIKTHGAMMVVVDGVHSMDVF